MRVTPCPWGHAACWHAQGFSLGRLSNEQRTSMRAVISLVRQRLYAATVRRSTHLRTLCTLQQTHVAAVATTLSSSVGRPSGCSTAAGSRRRGRLTDPTRNHAAARHKRLEPDLSSWRRCGATMPTSAALAFHKSWPRGTRSHSAGCSGGRCVSPCHRARLHQRANRAATPCCALSESQPETALR